MSVDSLPPDVLALVLSFLTTHQRLHCASFASKRWRAAALRATTSLADPVDIERAVQLLPRLERLRLTVGVSALPDGACLSSLRSLSLNRPPGRAGTPHLNLRSLVERTTLAELQLIDPDDGTLDICAASLSSLELTGNQFKKLTQLALPRLTTVKFVVNADAYPLLAYFLASVSTQLQSLFLIMDDARTAQLWEALASLSFPRLTHLSAAFTYTGPVPAGVAATLARCHPSVRLSLNHVQSALDPPSLARLEPWLTELSVKEEEGHPRLGRTCVDTLSACLARHSRLTSLSLRAHRYGKLLERMADEPAVASKLTSLSAWSLAHVHRFTRLSSLVVPAPLAPLPAPLPSLMHLRVGLATTLATLREGLRSYPRLRTLDANVAGEATLDELRAFAEAQPSAEVIKLGSVVYAASVQKQTVKTPRCVLKREIAA